MLPPILGTRKRVSFFITKKAGRKNEYKNDCLQITESPADARAKNKNQSDTGVFPESREDDNEIHCH